VSQIHIFLWTHLPLSDVLALTPFSVILIFIPRIHQRPESSTRVVVRVEQSNPLANVPQRHRLVTTDKEDGIAATVEWYLKPYPLLSTPLQHSLSLPNLFTSSNG
jgi:hypothetical protein